MKFRCLKWLMKTAHPMTFRKTAKAWEKTGDVLAFSHDSNLLCCRCFVLVRAG